VGLKNCLTDPRRAFRGPRLQRSCTKRLHGKLGGKFPHCLNSVETLFSRAGGGEEIINSLKTAPYLAEETSTSMFKTANTKLATSENIACNGCTWK